MNNLQKIAEGNGYTLFTLQRASQIPAATLTRYWNNTATDINLAYLEILCNLLAVSIDSLLSNNPVNLMSDKFND